MNYIYSKKRKEEMEKKWNLLSVHSDSFHWRNIQILSSTVRDHINIYSLFSRHCVVFFLSFYYIVFLQLVWKYHCFHNNVSRDALYHTFGIAQVLYFIFNAFVNNIVFTCDSLYRTLSAQAQWWLITTYVSVGRFCFFSACCTFLCVSHCSPYSSVDFHRINNVKQ